MRVATDDDVQAIDGGWLMWALPDLRYPGHRRFAQAGGDMTAEKERWHGWTVAGKSLHVGPLPGRKSICLYTSEASIGLKPLAYFRSEDDADACLAWLDRLAGSRFVLDTLSEAEPPKDGK